MSFFFVRLKCELSSAGQPENAKLRAHPTQSANSLVFGTVADKRMILTCSGSIMITSSQTTPR